MIISIYYNLLITIEEKQLTENVKDDFCNADAGIWLHNSLWKWLLCQMRWTSSHPKAVKRIQTTRWNPTNISCSLSWPVGTVRKRLWRSGMSITEVFEASHSLQKMSNYVRETFDLLCLRLARHLKCGMSHLSLCGDKLSSTSHLLDWAIFELISCNPKIRQLWRNWVRKVWSSEKVDSTKRIINSFPAIIISVKLELLMKCQNSTSDSC